MEICAVFDIGKTNKKLLGFNADFEVVFEKSAVFDEILDDDGDPCDDVMAIKNWMISEIEELMVAGIYNIKAINFSGYGASFVYINRKGHVIAPLYNYLKKLPREIKKQFLAIYNESGNFFKITSSPDLDMLNSGLQLYWLKKQKTHIYKNLAFALHLPQYLSYVFSNVAQSELTSIGCHTCMWDFENQKYMEWLSAEKISAINTPLVTADSTKKVNNVIIGAGIHDSSAALVPYLMTQNDPFLLISTGSWSISINPFNHQPLTSFELDNDCLCYIDYKGKPVKSSRLFSGNEHNRQVKHLAHYFGVSTEFYKKINYDPSIIKSLRKKHKQVLPHEADLGQLRESPFVARNLNTFNTVDEAYHQLILDLVSQQVASTNLVIGKTKVSKIILEGGFGKNLIFLKLLKEAYFGIDLYVSELKQGSALGAALTISQSWTAQGFTNEKLNLKKI